jgi:glycerophosphoryl diester phosphodiesterase
MTEKPLIVAHRGASRDAPENTPAAFMMAWLQHADAVEADLRLTKDKQIVCIHDPSTKRVSGKALEVAKTNLAVLKELDVGVKLFPKWRGQQIPTLAQLIATMPQGKSIFLELKTGSEILAPLKKEIAKAALDPKQIVIQSFDENLLAAVAEILPEHRTVLLINQRKLGKPSTWQPPAEKLMQHFKTSKAKGVNLNTPALAKSTDLVKALKEAGAEIHTWTVNRAINARPLLVHDLSSITTDRPGKLRVGLRW